ncbi:HAUS augmin-like complex subunit [Actinidia rufa]|uniref:HAUS augmin-like complex subunit n=1 Tax=Actinidia rufa TaxID=165716 RepID=A0A7J0GRC1_9ERIC|nr:HAUS augmin-like complex subunit [Actinidia rufa]
MSGTRLCALLGELGYQRARGIRSRQLRMAVPIRRRPTHPRLALLQPPPLQCPLSLRAFPVTYEQFLQEGKLLEGEDLDFAYDSISAFSTRRDNQEAVFGAEEGLKDIRDATLAYKAEALELQRQLRQLQTQYDMLTGQASSLIQGRRARIAATTTVNGQLTAIDDSLSARNLEMNAVLGRIASTTQELAHYHSGDVSAILFDEEYDALDKMDIVIPMLYSRVDIFHEELGCSEDDIYLAYSDFHPYLIVDASCVKELNQWFVKQLDTGPYRLVAEEGKAKCSWVSLDDISNILVRGALNACSLKMLDLLKGENKLGWTEY